MSGGVGPERRVFFTLKQIAEAARAERWPTGRALDESRRLLRRKRKAAA